MTVVALDTLAIVRKLRASGLPEDQAEAITGVIRDSRDADLTALAAKTDIHETELRLEAKIEATKADIIKSVLSAIGFQALIIVGAIVAMARVPH
ncbi:CCDC90 family protein [Methylobacterium sp. E-066]|uniref:CCDC90 family protein n=1 Tax=Methylobacterium sp. E-066 TaxID=2836584 RepID=UPI001FB8BFE3|nr:CCDC90 family protein [Methylobacterium sp. E-066]MCJ2139912.1 CCDC90 family protein [Methylobacterium sp. E-066]